MKVDGREIARAHLENKKAESKKHEESESKKHEASEKPEKWSLDDLGGAHLAMLKGIEEKDPEAVRMSLHDFIEHHLSKREKKSEAHE